MFFFNATATTEIYTLSLHDALPISRRSRAGDSSRRSRPRREAESWVFRCCRTRSTASSTPMDCRIPAISSRSARRSEEHTSELQSQSNLVCRLLLEKKKHKEQTNIT